MIVIVIVICCLACCWGDSCTTRRWKRSECQNVRMSEADPEVLRRKPWFGCVALLSTFIGAGSTVVVNM